MFAVGEISIKAKKLIKTTLMKLLMKAVEILKEDVQLGDIGSASTGTCCQLKVFQLHKIFVGTA